jgi:DNA polymerase-3 subunit epsilon
LGAKWEAVAVAVPTTWHARPTGRLRHLLGGGGRIAVVDAETTGLYNSDRIVEIAVVTIDANGEVEDEFETLTDPLRDVGPTWIHGIDARMLRNAPTFADVAQHVASRVEGAVVAGHNVRFDTRMIGHEFERAGIDIDWGVGLDTLAATRCKLEHACAEYGVAIHGPHRALVDARATADLMLAVADSFTQACRPAAAWPLVVTPMRVCRREGYVEVKPPAPYIASLSKGVRTSVDVAPYAHLLDVAIADLRLTGEERCQLHALATDLGLDDRAVTRAHREFLNGLIDAAIEDSIVTDDELGQLRRVAALLEVDVERVSRRTDPFRATTRTIELSAGITVCFTGLGRRDNGDIVDRVAQTRMAVDHGLVVVKSVTKKSPDLLVAADGDSRSEKARKARQNGIAIVTFSAFVRALRTGQPLEV